MLLLLYYYQVGLSQRLCKISYFILNFLKFFFPPSKINSALNSNLDAELKFYPNELVFNNKKEQPNSLITLFKVCATSSKFYIVHMSLVLSRLVVELICQLN